MFELIIKCSLYWLNHFTFYLTTFLKFNTNQLFRDLGVIESKKYMIVKCFENSYRINQNKLKKVNWLVRNKESITILKTLERAIYK